MTDWTAGVCQTNGIIIHYTRTGGGKPPWVVHHGLMTSGLCWTELAQALEHEHDVIMPDARGHGQSSAPEHGYSYQDHAADLAGFIQALRLPPVFLLGHSMGGMTAAVVASRYPELLRALVLADPTFLSPKVQQEVWKSDVADQHRRVLALPLKALLAEARGRHPNRSEQTLALFAQARLQTSLSAFEVLRPPNPDYAAMVRAISIPCLLLYGDKGIVSAVVAAELQRLHPGLQAEQIREAGHVVHLDQPERFTAAVKRFLRSMEDNGSTETC